MLQRLRRGHARALVDNEQRGDEALCLRARIPPPPPPRRERGRADTRRASRRARCPTRRPSRASKNQNAPRRSCHSATRCRTASARARTGEKGVSHRAQPQCERNPDASACVRCAYHEWQRARAYRGVQRREERREPANQNVCEHAKRPAVRGEGDDALGVQLRRDKQRRAKGPLRGRARRLPCAIVTTSEVNSNNTHTQTHTDTHRHTETHTDTHTHTHTHTMPKSHSFAVPSVVSSTLSGFTSRCTTPTS